MGVGGVESTSLTAVGIVVMRFKWGGVKTNTALTYKRQRISRMELHTLLNTAIYQVVNERRQILALTWKCTLSGNRKGATYMEPEFQRSCVYFLTSYHVCIICN